MLRFDCARAKILLYMCFTVFLFLNAQGQTANATDDIKFTYLTREKGLSNSSVISIIQDFKGYMWFGTEDGLNRYDGDKFTVYKNNPNQTSSLTSNTINQLFEDHEHKLWIGTNFGLNLYDRQQDKFVRFVNANESANRISSNKVNDIFEDSKQNIWVSTSYGLNLYDRVHNSFLHYTHKTQNPEGSGINAFNCTYEDKTGKLWAGTDGGGIEQFLPASKTFKALENAAGSVSKMNHLRISTIKADLQGNVWIGTIGNGLLLFNTAKNTVRSYVYEQDNPSSLSNNVIKCILCDKNGNVWIGTENGGLSVWDAQQQVFKRYENNTLNPSGLSQKTASAIFEDNQANIWIGTHKGGINIYSPNAYKFKRYAEGTSPGTLSFKDVKTFFEDEDGIIWIGTDGGGINLWNRKTNTFQQLHYNPSNKNSIGSDAVLKIIKDRTGDIWLCTWGGGINRYNKKSKSFTRFLHNPANKNSISSNDVCYVHEDKKGYLWIGTFYAGLSFFDPATQKFSSLSYSPDGKSHFIGTNVMVIEEDADGNLWFGTEEGVLNRLTADRQHFYNYFNDGHNDVINSVNCIFKDSKNRLWVGKTGLYLFNPSQNKFSLFSNNTFLSNDNIESINEDDAGNLWIGTSNGLIKFNPETKYFQRFTESDGLQGLEFRQNATLKTVSGELLFGGLQGFNTFFPKNIKNNNYPSPIYITGLQVFNKEVDHNEKNAPIEGNIGEAKKIILNYDQSEFSLEYAGLNYVSPAKTEYAYFLKNFDQDWHYVGTQKKATYTNLDPGEYTFYVKSTAADGKWNKKTASIKVIIKPPFWRTWWFNTLLLITLFSIVFLLLYFRRKAELKKFNEQKREEIHQSQLQFFTNISHEFRTPLTLILGMLDQILKKESRTEFIRHYQTIHRNANRLLQLLSELMDFRKAEIGALKLKVMASDISPFMADIVFDFYDVALQHKIDFTVNYTIRLSQKWFDPQIVQKIAINLINNAFKYTQDGGKIKIDIASSFPALDQPFENTLTLENEFRGSEYIYISIADTGIGISKESINHLFERYYRITDTHLGSGVGLAFVKSLTFLHKGNIYVYSERNMGTQFIIALPCGKLDYTKEEKWLGMTVEGGVQLESIKNNMQNVRNSFDLDVTEIKPAIKNKEQCILIVDDNAELRDYIKEILQPYYKTIEAKNGAEGILCAKEQSPSLIISDVMMPVMDGLEFCNLVKTDFETSHIPFILLTAKDAIESRLKGIETGADYYFSKPINTDLLLFTIKNLFDNREKIKNRYYKDYQVEVRELVHTAKDKDFMDQLLKLIEEKLEEQELNVDYVCQQIGISKTKLYKKIKDITGQTINEFIRTIKLKKATDIMTHEDVSISDVMFRVGISSQSYFTAIFKKEFGITPFQFQQQLDSNKTVKS